MTQQNDLRLNRIVEAAPEKCKCDKFWGNIMQIYADRLRVYAKAEDYKPFTSFSLLVQNKLFDRVINQELKNRYFDMLLKKFLTEVKFTPFLLKLELSNFIVS